MGLVMTFSNLVSFYILYNYSIRYILLSVQICLKLKKLHIINFSFLIVLNIYIFLVQNDMFRLNILL